MSSNIKIVVIDDTAEILELLDVVLTDEGFLVVPCREAGDALEMVATERPALVIADLVMGGVPQWDLVDALIADPRTGQTPIIVCSGATHELRAGKSRLQANGCDVLVKPFAIDILLDKVRHLIARSRQA